MADQSYLKVVEDLTRWKNEADIQIEQMFESTRNEITKTMNDIQDFCLLADALLIEQENQLEQAKDNEQIDLIEKQIEQILPEIEFLQSKKDSLVRLQIPSIFSIIFTIKHSINLHSSSS